MQTVLFDIGTFGTLEFALIAAIVAFLAVLRPVIWLALLCAQPYLLTAFATEPGSRVALYLAYVVIGVVALRISNRVKWRRLRSGLSVPVVMLLGWASISFLLYPTLDGSLASSMSRIIMVGSLAPYILIVARLTTFSDVQVFLKHILRWLIIVQMLYAFAVAFAAQIGYSIESFNQVAIAGVTLYFSQGGLTLILVTSYLTWGDNLSPYVRWALMAAGALGFMLIVADGSRTILVVALLAVLFIAWQRKKLMTYLAGGIASFLILFLVLLATRPDILNAITTTWEGRLAQSTSSDLRELSSGRDLIYESVWYSFLESPLVGVGVGNAVEPLMFNGVLVRPNPHNFYLGTLGHQGLLGLSLVVLIVVVGFHRGRTLWKITTAAPHERRLVLLVITMVGYGTLCMAFKADYGITFWALGLLEVLYQAALQGKAGQWAAARLQIA